MKSLPFVAMLFSACLLNFLSSSADASTTTQLRYDGEAIVEFDYWRKFKEHSTDHFDPCCLPQRAKSASLFVVLPFQLTANTAYSVQRGEISLTVKTNERIYSTFAANAGDLGVFDAFDWDFATDANGRISTLSLSALAGGSPDHFIWYLNGYLDDLSYEYEHIVNTPGVTLFPVSFIDTIPDPVAGTWAVVPAPLPGFLLISGMALMGFLRVSSRRPC